MSENYDVYSLGGAMNLPLYFHKRNGADLPQLAVGKPIAQEGNEERWILE